MYVRRVTKRKLREGGIRITGPCSMWIDLSRANAETDPHIMLKFEVRDGTRVEDDPRVPDDFMPKRAEGLSNGR